MIVKLETWEYEYASNIGIRRFTNNWGKENAPWYNPAKMEDNRTALVASAIGELAVAKATNEYWHASIWKNSNHNDYRNMPDVGKNIEVRRVRTQNGPAVREKDLTKENLYIFGVIPLAPEFVEVEILGWIRADFGWNEGIPTEYGKIIPRTKLSPVETWRKL